MKKKLCILLCILITLCLCACSGKTKSSSASSAKKDETMQSSNNEKTIVTTGKGKIQGTMTDGVYRFLGVPYAEADELFMPAEEVPAWEGILDASDYGPVSYQSSVSGSTGSGAAEYSNDCQNLNIWTPGTDGEKRPVMVWLHGGGLAFGSANDAAYDGANLAGNQDVVVVGVNHRLGVYGFLDLSFADEKYKNSDNLCILDIIDALQWIRDNIEQFGGDPDNVTLFGQSGGGVKIIALMSSPYAKGLFNRAIIESGATDRQGVTFTDKEVSAALGKEILKNLNISEDDIEQLNDVSNADLQNAADLAVHTIGEEYQIPQSIWASFARTGVPEVPGADTWEPYTRENGAVMILDEESYLAHHHDEKLLELLAPDYVW
jgi:para-nitrobenzyl esterase